MVNTGYEDRESIIKHRASGYSLRQDTLRTAPFVDMSIPYSAGGLYSTVEDMYLWDQALYTEKLISRKNLDAMFTPFKGNYGYGWDVGELFGRRCTSHMGWIEGYASYILRVPDDRLTVVVMSNVDGAPVNSMARDLAAIALGVRRAAMREHKAVEADPSLYDAYAGQYELAPDFVVTVTNEGGRLTAQAPGRPKLQLLPESEVEFFIKEYDAQIMFVWDGKGQVTHAVISLNGREAQAEKIK
jgi:CubicO group peptidase (beta-lactamase class C family)